MDAKISPYYLKEKETTERQIAIKQTNKIL